MNEISPNPILEFNPNQMMEVRKLFGYDDLNRLQQDIKILDSWIKKQEHFLVKEYDERYLELHLIRGKGSIERAKKHIDKLCTLRGLMPEYLQGFYIKNEFNNLLTATSNCVLPKPTPDNYRVIFNNYFHVDARLYEEKDMARYLLLIVEYLHRHDYNAGIEMIIDASNITFGVVTKTNPMVVSNTLMLICDALGLRLKAMHIIGGSKYVNALIVIIKRAMSKKLMSRLLIHENYEALFKFVPKDIIPKELGGDMPITVKEINENNDKEFSSPEFIKIMKQIENAVTDESKRLGSQFNEDYSGMPGSFKFLTVD